MFSGDDCKELGLSMCGVLIMERDMIIEPDKITSSDGQVMKEVAKPNLNIQEYLTFTG